MICYLLWFRVVYYHLVIDEGRNRQTNTETLAQIHEIHADMLSTRKRGEVDVA